MRIVDEEAVPLTRDEALTLLVALEEQQQAAEAEVDQRIARFNSEGGFTLN